MDEIKRIDFIDLAKGICIILVVIGHCGVSKYIPGYEIVRMPLYFVLSGLFFKNYGFYNKEKQQDPYSFFVFLFYWICYFLCFERIFPIFAANRRQGNI